MDIVLDGEGKEPLVNPTPPTSYIYRTQAKQVNNWTKYFLMTFIVILFILMGILLFLVFSNIFHHHPTGYGGGVEINSCKGFQNFGGSLSSITVSPYPVHLPGRISISFEAAFQRELMPQSQIHIQIKHNLFWFFWMTVFEGDFNVCSLLHDNCPISFGQYGIPCSCPILPGTYSFPMTDVGMLVDFVPNHNILWTSGEYWMKAIISSGPVIINSTQTVIPMGTPFACQEFSFSVISLA